MAPSVFRHLRDRPSLTGGLAIAVVAGAGATLILRPSLAVLVGWCCGAAAYLVFAAVTALRAPPELLAQRATQLDPGSGFIFTVAAGAAIASIASIVIDLGHAHANPAELGFSLSLAAATLFLSWMFIHTVFAFHYAHMFYLDRTSLTFPGAAMPDLWDFLYFSCVIGMTAQVSDVTTGTPAMRRLVLVHGIIAFFFNTAILALGVNLAAGLAS